MKHMKEDLIKADVVEREKRIYEQYQEIIAPFIIELEVRDNEYPIELFNEIRSIFTHLSRYKVQSSEEDISLAEGHVKRAILDCYKYLCISISEKIRNFRNEYRNTDLGIADNGEFLPKLNQYEAFAMKKYKEAKQAEIAKVSTEHQYILYEEAYNAYADLDKFLDDSTEAVLFASKKSKHHHYITLISCVITIISIVVSAIALVG